ncbi:MAG TPA: ABC transporter permease subunit [Oligoflexia bacterium]|nr:ABC transporter permease subunit [Oligoflexia bacterium]HMP26945.1 ABC transporter permease subunit [Oligoflexia bacterium]
MMKANFLQPILALALNTYRESVRSKILYLAIFFCFFLIVVSSLFAKVSVGDAAQTVKDFGLASCSIFAVAFAVISGAMLLNKELLRKTIYNILSKPVMRWQFVFGKYLGMLLTVGLLILLMTAGLYLYLYLVFAQLDPLIWYGSFFIFLELVILCAVAMFFSALVVTPVLSGIFTFSIFIAGRSVSYLTQYFSQQNLNEPLEAVIQMLYWTLPRLDNLNLINAVVFENFEILSFDRFFFSCLYAISYALVMLMLAAYFFKKREFN